MSYLNSNFRALGSIRQGWKLGTFHKFQISLLCELPGRSHCCLMDVGPLLKNQPSVAQEHASAAFSH